MFHLTTKHVARSSGRSSVAAAAYRAGVKLKNERDGMIHDYCNRKGVLHTEIVVPRGVKSEWALDRERLWNAAEKAELRKDSRTAREVEFGLPAELSFEQQIELTREIGTYLANLYGTVADIAIHAPSKTGDQRNYHVHILMPTRSVGIDELGEKTMFERSDKWLRSRNLPTGKKQLLDIREAGGQIMNHHLAKAGLDVRVDHRSHKDRGLTIKPTKHVGVQAKAIERKGKKVHRRRISEEDKKFNKTFIGNDSEELLGIITSERSVFDMRDVARCIHRYTDLKGKDFQELFTYVMRSPSLVTLQTEYVDESGNRVLAKYSTREMVEVEFRLMANAVDLNRQKHAVAQKHVDRSILKLDKQLQAKFGSHVGTEQREAIEHLTGSNRLSIMVGHAGSGKSTVLSVARQAWQAQGYNVIGTALSGKASDGLEQSSGIGSQTLASLERKFAKGFRLGKRDVLVVDETGMIDNKQLDRLIANVSASGAKLVLVGDPDQLQPIGAGGAFRALAEAVGSYSLTEIRRQKVSWQAQASKDFATMRTSQGLRKYDLRRAIKFDRSKFDSIKSVVEDYVSDSRKSPAGTRLAISHRQSDVRMLNSAIRTALQVSGELPTKGEMVYQTREGLKSFVKGDRVALQANNKSLGLKNGMLATVVKVNKNTMTIILDDSNRRVKIPMDSYKAISHGYASTIHKSQGMTVDSSYVLASKSMDRNLTYVAMTRHSDNARMYASRNDFSNRENMFEALSRGNEKKSILDFMDDFGERRGFERDDDTVFDFKPRNWQSQENDLSDLDRALDFFCMSMEERLWLKFHGVKEGALPRPKLEHAFGMLRKINPGLPRIVIDTVKSNDKHLEEIFMVQSGTDRVAMFKKAMADERKTFKRKQHPEPPIPTPTFGL